MEARLMIFGYILFSLSIVTDIIFLIISRIVIEAVFFTSFSFIGLILLSLIYSLNLVNKFNNEYFKLEELSGKLNIKVREQTVKIVNLMEQKTLFFINLAHETKTPLTLISSYLNRYVQKHGADQEIRIIKNNIDKLSADMVNFLDAEKIEQGRIRYEDNVNINISSYLRQKLILFRNIAGKKTQQ